MSIKRRELLRNLGGLYAWASLPGLIACEDGAPDPVDRPEFRHGVASGDPLPDAVILWTRVTVPDAAQPIEVSWELSEALDFREIVASGSVQTDARRDFTVKVDADGLESGRVYYYRFRAGQSSSPIGRTQTAVSGDVKRLRFAVMSCASLAHGYFHAYRSVSQRLDLDAVIHLGDYIYEYGTGEYGNIRAYEPPVRLVTLRDYRMRYSQYRRDPDLQALHQQLPLISIWDDHEFANNAFVAGAENHHPELGDGEYPTRKAAALQAYAEWMPIREPSAGRCFRSFKFGDLADLIMLDTRVWGRQQQLAAPSDPALVDPARTLLGRDQESWLGERLQSSSARWRLIGQQVMVGRYPIETNLDTWEGYPAARQRLLEQLRSAPAGDSVILTGDVHSSWAMHVVDQPLAAGYDPTTGAGAVAVEFVTPGVTSPLLSPAQGEAWRPVVLSHPHVKYVQLWRRGYMVLDVDAERVQAAWYHYDAVESPEPVEPSFAAAAATYRGERRVRLEAEPAPAGTPLAAAAPAAEDNGV